MTGDKPRTAPFTIYRERADRLKLGVLEAAYQQALILQDNKNRGADAAARKAKSALDGAWKAGGLNHIAREQLFAHLEETRPTTAPETTLTPWKETLPPELAELIGGDEALGKKVGHQVAILRYQPSRNAIKNVKWTIIGALNGKMEPEALHDLVKGICDELSGVSTTAPAPLEDVGTQRPDSYTQNLISEPQIPLQVLADQNPEVSRSMKALSSAFRLNLPSPRKQESFCQACRAAGTSYDDAQHYIGEILASVRRGRENLGHGR